MINDISHYLEKWLPSFIDDNRSYLTVAIGCTGGQHRSVYVAQTLTERFKLTQKVLTRHRELNEEQYKVVNRSREGMVQLDKVHCNHADK